MAEHKIHTGEGARFRVIWFEGERWVLVDTALESDVAVVLLSVSEGNTDVGSTSLVRLCNLLNELHEDASAHLGENTTLDEGFRLG